MIYNILPLFYKQSIVLANKLFCFYFFLKYNSMDLI